MKDSFYSIFTHLTNEEKDLLLNLSTSLPENSTIVEVGSYLGASTCFLAYGIKNKGGTVYAVDCWKNKAMSEGERDTFDEFNRNVEPLKDVIKPLRGFSNEIAEQFDKKIDLLFVDGDHSYDGVCSDLKAWLPKMKENSLVVFHDYSWAIGVQIAVNKYVIPIQVEPAIRLDSIYWTRVKPARLKKSSIYATVVIPTYNRNQYVLEALQGILEQDTKIQYEVLIMDNACDPVLQKKVETISANTHVPLRYIPVPDVGLHNCRNLATFEGNGEVIVFIDDDIIASPQWLTGICKPFLENDAAGVGGKILPKWEGLKPEWIDAVNHSYFSVLDLGETCRKMKLPETPYGCNMAYRRNVIIDLEGFSPDAMGNSFIEWKRGDGESGFARKVYDKGKSIYYVADGYLYHRIPSERMTIKFIRKRTVKSAISLSYMDMRANKYSSSTLVKIALKNLYLLIKAILKNTGRIFKNKTDINFQISIVYYFISFIYQTRLAVDTRLRRWVLQDNYFYPAK